MCNAKNFAIVFVLLLRTSFLSHCVKSVLIWGYSGRHFSAFELNTKKYWVSLRIHPECGKMRTTITLEADTFYAVLVVQKRTGKSFLKMFHHALLIKRVTNIGLVPLDTLVIFVGNLLIVNQDPCDSWHAIWFLDKMLVMAVLSKHMDVINVLHNVKPALYTVTSTKGWIFTEIYQYLSECKINLFHGSISKKNQK